MTQRSYAGGAATLVLNGGIAASGVTTINTTGTATGWPVGATGKFYIVIDRGLSSEEKILCTSRTGNALSVASDGDRGQDGTSAQTHVSGAQVQHCIASPDVSEPNVHINVTAGDDHTQYMKTDGTRHDLSARHTFGAALTAATPVAVGAANATGAATTVPRGDHVHLGPGRLGSASVTADQFGIDGTLTDLTSLTATVTVVAGRRIMIIGSCHLGGDTADDEYNLAIREGGTILQQSALTQVVANRIIHMTAIWFLSPSAGAHTYKLSAQRTVGTGSMFMSAAATFPAFILVEDIGT